ncbi:S8 family peptidase [Aestuariibaculum suncheonense]|uniref:S8 family serine peptidase n=1 Tax=Aestuariibaculum suncheonense TaxID=1028745 RepID=A0A8J6UBM7_9FLAO|nr:S8 family peptidase [Aestuariibaculum suncheonense]MBD0836040.1 S8 family serine peptidase [Aestuariibaculum suncheonense]
MKKKYLPQDFILSCLIVFFISFSAFAQKNKDITPVVECVKDLTNGLYQATFSYYNPTNKEVVIDESGSIIKTNNGKKVAKGLNRFKPGRVEKVFTKEFGPHDYVEWTIISNGNSHTVIANANSSKCELDDGIVFPVIGNNGKSYDIIGQELSALCDNVAGETPSDIIFKFEEGKVLVEIVPKAFQMQAVLNLLQGAPFNIPASDFLLDIPEFLNLAAIDVFFNPADLCALNNYGDIINFARPAFPAYNNSAGFQEGERIVTQGDAAQTSNLVRQSFRIIQSDGTILPVNGTGVKIGVLSDSYDMALGVPQYAALDVGNDELPEGIEVLEDNKYKSSDEGRAMMQIIYDVAPGAAMAFHTATASPRQFEVGFNALKDAGCDIIVDDITFITEPFFGMGRISQEIQQYVSEPGNFHYTSAGNLANKAYQATFNSSPTTPVTNFIPSGTPTVAHVFGANTDGSPDYLQKISVVPGTYLIVLQWKEDLASQENQLGADNDLDIYIVDDAGRLLVGNNRENVNGDPTEIIVFRATGTGDANILITSANGPTNVPFRYIAFRTTADDGTDNGLSFPEYFGNGAPTVSGHAMNPESVTVGAVDYRYAENPVAEYFSSYGGLLKDGVNLEIDMYAPDGGNTASTTIGRDSTCDTCDTDTALNFYGTSAAAPHAAAAMALLKSALPYWYPDGAGASTYSNSDALSTFKNTGVNFTALDGSAGQFLNTVNAFKSIAAQTARITSLTILSGNVGVEPITLSIIGEFFPSPSQEPYPAKVYFDGQEITDIQEISENEIVVTIPEFTGNPELKIYTAPKPGTEGNGGFSEPVKILPDGKYLINIVPNNEVFEYGQDISLSYYVQGLPLEDIQDPSLSYPEIMAALGFPEVVLSSAADEKLALGEYPIVFDYAIKPSFAEAMSPELSEKYQVNFISGYLDAEIGKVGYLTITKKDLVITPKDVVYTYGDAISIDFNYQFNPSGMSDEDGFRLLIDETHATDFKDGIPSKFQAVVNKFQAVVNDYDVSFLEGGSWSASERTIQNKFQAVVNGMNIISLSNENITNYISAKEDFDNGTTNKFQAVVNKFQAVVNAEDLFTGNVELGIENKFQAVVNKFQAVVNSDDPEHPFKDYAQMFTVIDAEDAPPEDGSDDERAISKIYALNMLTGIDVTPTVNDKHYVYPGAFLNAMAANFNIVYEAGNVIINPKDLQVSTENLTIAYGDILTENMLLALTTFDGWAFEGDAMESVETVFPDGVPFYFVKDNEEFELSELNALGNYQIKVRNPKNYNVISAYNDVYGTLTISPATLNVVILPEDSVVLQGAIPDLTFEFSGFVADDTESSVFPQGVPYYFIDDNGTKFYDTNIPGSYYLKLEDIENYTIIANTAHIFINPSDSSRKVRTYADCVAYNPNEIGDLKYTVIYRYENDNDYPVYVNEGEDNKLTGAAYSGELPTVFMPGAGTFEIKFDGSQLVWSLTTYDGTQKSSVSSASTSESGKCDAKLDGAYAIYPNPVSTLLTIEQNIFESNASVLVINMYGFVVIDAGVFEQPLSTKQIDMSALPTGLYIVRISSEIEVRTYNILKE